MHRLNSDENAVVFKYLAPFKLSPPIFAQGSAQKSNPLGQMAHGF